MVVLSCLRVAKKNKVAPVRQKVGPAMCFFFGVDLCCEHWSPALRRNALQTFWSSEQDHPFATPGRATLFARVAQLLRTSVRRIDSKQFSSCEVTDGTAIG